MQIVAKQGGLFKKTGTGKKAASSARRSSGEFMRSLIC